MLTYGSVCSGIEAASVAWEPLGFKPKWFSEIEPFPSAVLNHHWPSVTNLGDMTKIASRIQSGEVEAPDVLVGGTPCQAFSVAGARKGLADERGQLTISYGELADAIDDIRIAGGKHPAIIVWENVPGVLSSKDNAFGAFLGLLSGEECELVPSGSKWTNAGYVHGPKRAIAWRILDAQYFGVAQRRRRLFIVASAREGFDPTAVLFEREGVRRDTAPSREAGKEAPALTANGVGTCCADDNQGQAGHLIPTTVAVNDVAGTMSSAGGTAHKHGFGWGQQDWENGYCQPVVSVHGTQDPDTNTEQAHTLGRNHGQENAVLTQYGYELAGTLTARHDSSPCADRGQNMVVCDQEPTPINLQVITRHESLGRGTGFGLGLPGEAAYTLGAAHMHGVWSGLAVRRLTPVECERLQGFPDGHTQVPYRGKPASDGPRYKALGNSMAVCCMSWIGQRILSQINLAIPFIQNYALEHSISDDEHCALKGEYPVEFQYDLFREYA